MDTEKSLATLGKIAIMTNSVMPSPKVPIARETRALFTIKFIVFKHKGTKTLSKEIQ